MEVKTTDLYYRGSHKILLVGEGDFSYSLHLAKSFGTAVNIVATSNLDSRESLERIYAGALSNLAELEGLGCNIVHGVDARTLDRHPLLRRKKFDRIVFSFPQAGFIWDNDNPPMNRIRLELFLKNAKALLNVGGQIHITHKTTSPFGKWDMKKPTESEGSFDIGDLVVFVFWFVFFIILFHVSFPIFE